jgi:hypothetical protein
MYARKLPIQSIQSAWHSWPETRRFDAACLVIAESILFDLQHQSLLCNSEGVLSIQLKATAIAIDAWRKATKPMQKAIGQATSKSANTIQSTKQAIIPSHTTNQEIRRSRNSNSEGTLPELPWQNHPKMKASLPRVTWKRESVPTFQEKVFQLSQEKVFQLSQAKVFQLSEAKVIRPSQKERAIQLSNQWLSQRQQSGCT